MFLHHRRLIPTALMAVVLTSMPACGGDSPTENTGDALSAAEAQELVLAVFDVLDLIDIPLLENGPAAARVSVPYGDLYEDVIDGQMACDGAGMATIGGLITGDVDDDAGTADIDINATVEIIDCLHVGETSTLTLEGAPDVDIMANILISEASISITIDITGGVSFTSNDGRSGSCALDVTVAASGSSTGVTENTTGTACGISASAIDVSLF